MPSKTVAKVETPAASDAGTEKVEKAAIAALAPSNEADEEEAGWQFSEAEAEAEDFDPGSLPASPTQPAPPPPAIDDNTPERPLLSPAEALKRIPPELQEQLKNELGASFRGVMRLSKPR